MSDAGEHDDIEPERSRHVCPRGAPARFGYCDGADSCDRHRARWYADAREDSVLTKLVFTFPDSKRAQQFGGWLFLAGYTDRVLKQNTVTVEVRRGKRTRIIKEAAGRGGRLM